MVAASGPFDELLFSSFVMHGRVHFIHISLEPSKGLAEITNKSCDFPYRTAAGLATIIVPLRGASPRPSVCLDQPRFSARQVAAAPLVLTLAARALKTGGELRFPFAHRVTASARDQRGCNALGPFGTMVRSSHKALRVGRARGGTGHVV